MTTSFTVTKELFFKAARLASKSLRLSWYATNPQVIVVSLIVFATLQYLSVYFFFLTNKPLQPTPINFILCFLLGAFFFLLFIVYFILMIKFNENRVHKVQFHRYKDITQGNPVYISIKDEHITTKADLHTSTYRLSYFSDKIESEDVIILINKSSQTFIFMPLENWKEIEPEWNKIMNKNN